MANPVRDALRAATVGAVRARTGEIVDLNGAQIEVRKPSVAERYEIIQNASKDNGKGVDLRKMHATALINLCYIPGTDERVFEDADMASLTDTEAGGWSDVLFEVAQKFINVKSSTLAKNSESPANAN